MNRTFKLAALSLCIFVATHSSLNAQIAPDWTLTDIEGNTHNLYSDLDAGYPVIIEFFATWCGFCWNDHTAGVLQDFYELHGPNGDDTYRVYMIEADQNTNQQAIAGVGPTHGNWVVGHDIPIIEGESIVSAYGVSGVPRYYMVCPEDRTLRNFSPNSIAHIENDVFDTCPTWTGAPVGVVNNAPITFQGSVGFQGYQEGGQMSSYLVDNGLLPMSQPFSIAPFNYNGNENITNIPNNTVDWVMVELRDANNESMVIDRKAALVNKSGNIIGTDGSLGVAFDNAAPGNYFVVVHHAGHSSIMSANTMTIPNNTTYDFRFSPSMVKGSEQMELIDGLYVMRSGDYDNSGTTNFTDFVYWLQNNNKFDTYAAYDADGNATVNFSDFVLWLRNNNHFRYPGI